MRDIQNYNMEHVDTLAPDTIKESVMCRHSQLSLLLADIQGRISNAPEGSLRTARKAHGCQYYHKVEVNDTKGTYIKKHNYNLAIELAQKDYDLRIEQCLLKELNFLEVILKKYNPSEIQHIYDSLNSFRKEMVTPVFVSDEDFTANWKASEYTSLGFTPDCAEYYTDNGERVRSKSEIIIANKLYRYNIPYRYEYPLQLQSGIITHPDFTCLNVKTRQEYIKFMKDNDILCVFHYVPLHSAPAGIKFGRFSELDVYTTVESDRLVRLPMYYHLQENDIQKVIDKTLEFFGERNNDK